MHTTSSGAPPTDNSLEARLERIERMLMAMQRPSPDPSELTTRLDAILDRLSAFDAVADNVPLMLATVTEMFDETAARIPDVDHRLRKAREIVERLTRPRTLAALESMLDLVEEAPKLIAAGADVFDEAVQHLADSGVRVDNLLETIRDLASRFANLLTTPELPALFDSGMLDARALETLGKAARSLAQVRENPPAPVGIFGSLRALSDPNVQRSLGFLLGVAQAFGNQIDNKGALPAPR